MPSSVVPRTHERATKNSQTRNQLLKPVFHACCCEGVQGGVRPDPTRLLVQSCTTGSKLRRLRNIYTIAQVQRAVKRVLKAMSTCINTNMARTNSHTTQTDGRTDEQSIRHSTRRTLENRLARSVDVIMAPSAYLPSVLLYTWRVRPSRNRPR
jgi:hypothetical protein